MSVLPGTIGVRADKRSDETPVVVRPGDGQFIALAIDNEHEQALSCEEIFVRRFSTQCRETGSEDRFCYTAPQWPRDLRFAAWIHPLNLASAVLSFKLQVVGRCGHHVAEFSRSPHRRQGSRFARPAQAGCGLDDELGRAHVWLLRDGQVELSSRC